MKLSTLVGGAVLGGDVDVTSLSYDSRRVQPGALFACFRGAKNDGRAFITDALARGATALLVSDLVSAPVPVVVRPNVRLALAECARRFYGDPSAELVTVGITGTKGKTTTTFLVEAILRAAGHIVGRLGTLGWAGPDGTQDFGLTTPESVDIMERLRALRFFGGTAFVMEVSSHALVQERVAGVDFDVCAFTNLGRDHLDYHGTMDAYLKAKLRLLSERQKPGGTAIVGADDAALAPYGVGAWTFGLAPKASVCAVNVRRTPMGQNITVGQGSSALEVETALLGAFNVQNVLCAVAVARALGIADAQIAAGVARVTQVPGRLERVSETGEPLVVVDFAHTPEALLGALRAARELASGKLFCVFGAGGDRDAMKRGPMGQAVGALADCAVVTNDNPRDEDPRVIAQALCTGLESAGKRESSVVAQDAYVVMLDRHEAIAAAISAAGPEDVVVIAGKGHETYQEAEGVRVAFDDRTVARACLATWHMPAAAAGQLE